MMVDNELDSDEPEWVIEQAKARRRQGMLRQREEMEARLVKIRAKEKAQRERYLKGDHRQKKRKTEENSAGTEGDDEQFMLDDYDSDGEQHGSNDGRAGSGLSSATLQLMSKLGMNLDSSKDNEEEAEDEIKAGHSPRY